MSAVERHHVDLPSQSNFEWRTRLCLYLEGNGCKHTAIAVIFRFGKTFGAVGFDSQT